MARFTRHTKITEVAIVPPDFPLYAYTLVSFDILRTRIGQKQLLSGHHLALHTASYITHIMPFFLFTYKYGSFWSDTIGLVTGISHVKTVLARGIMKTVRSMNVTNGR